MLKSCRTLSMTVRGPAVDPRCRGGHPIWPQNRQQTCSWMDRQGRPASPPPVNPQDSRYRHRTRRVDLDIGPGQSLGLMIRGGLEYGLGIYVTGVDKDSVADRAGLLVSTHFNWFSFSRLFPRLFSQIMLDFCQTFLQTFSRLFSQILLDFCPTFF